MQIFSFWGKKSCNTRIENTLQAICVSLINGSMKEEVQVLEEVFRQTFLDEKCLKE